MKYPNPDHVINTVYQDTNGAYRYRASHANARAIHYKLIPTYTRADGGINLVFSRYIVPTVLYQPFIDKVAHIPPDTRTVIMPVLDDVELRALGQIEGLQRTKTREEEEGYKGQLYYTIGEYYKILPDIKKLAAMFIVGETLVHSALRTRKLGIYADEYSTSAKTPAQVRKEQELAALKADIRYRKISVLLARARTMYHNKGIPMRVFKEDVFPKYQGEPYIPKVCPVLKIELSYEIDKGKKQPNDAAIGRMSTREDPNPENVTIMSYMARQLIEGTMSVARTNSLLSSMGLETEWNKWKLAHE